MLRDVDHWNPAGQFGRDTMLIVVVKLVSNVVANGLQETTVINFIERGDS